ncbi:MOSC domain-containing protein [Chloroflexota bacterium]
MALVIAVCKSKKKGTRKEPVVEGILKEDYGLIDDAHADCLTHRQVSLLAIESINKMQNLGFKLNPGDFAENITTEGIELISLPIGTNLSIGNEVVLEMTQIGKECHAACAIRKQVGKCIMPEEGIFTRVIKGGVIKPKDRVEIKESE